MMSHKSEELQAFLCPDGFRQLPVPGGMAYARQDVDEKQLQALLTYEGEVLKTSEKSRVRRLGHWVIKETRHGLASGLVGHGRSRSRAPWIALHYLRQHGVRVPEPLAYVEYGRLGMVKAGAQIFQYLSFSYDVETYLSMRIREGVDGEAIAAFLAELARAVNKLGESGAWHADLSGKNIMTRDGAQFYFVDLEAVEIGCVYDDEKRLKNHIQLYDSFCDALSDALLVPFIEAMLPNNLDLRVWMPRVRQAQRERRARIEARWAKYGPPERLNPLRAFRFDQPHEQER